MRHNVDKKRYAVTIMLKKMQLCMKYLELFLCFWVHIRSSNLNGYSHQIKLAGTIETTDEIYVIAKQLIDEMWKGEPVRAMSVSLSDLYGHNQVQLSMFDSKNKERNEKLDKVVDEIRKLFGDGSIFRGRFANTEISPIQGGVNDGDYIMMGGFKQ